MAWPPVAADLYAYAAPESYFAGVAGAAITAALGAAFGELSTSLSSRVGGDPASWTWEHASGQAQATRDVCIVAGSSLAMATGIVLPGEGSDPHWVAWAKSTRALWRDMGAFSAPLYAGLVDATTGTLEGRARGWSTPLPYAEEAEA